MTNGFEVHTPRKGDDQVELVLILDSRAPLVLSFLVMLLSDLFAVRGAYGEDLSTVAQRAPTYMSQDRSCLLMWGIVCFLQLLFVTAQCCPAKAIEEFFTTNVRYSVTLVYFLNAIYLPLFVCSYHVAAFIVSLAYLGALLNVVAVFNTKAVDFPVQWVMCVFPNVVHATWVATVAVVDFFVVSGLGGWRDEFGIAGCPLAAVTAIMLLTIAATWLAISRREATSALVIAWVLAGVARLQGGDEPFSFPPQAASEAVAVAAQSGGMICVGAAAVGVFLLVLAPWRRNGDYEPIALQP